VGVFDDFCGIGAESFARRGNAAFKSFLQDLVAGRRRGRQPAFRDRKHNCLHVFWQARTVQII
jgi:hypothetical protein